MLVKEAVYKALLRTERVSRRSRLGRTWARVKRWADGRWGDELVRTVLHGQSVLIHFANPYPILVRRFSNYNAPQVELVFATAAALRRPIHVVDVGAAVGDTALLILERCSSSIRRLDCVEGAPDFASLLEENITDGRVFVHNCMLAASAGSVPTLVRSQHKGTASAEGKERIPAVTLDSLLQGKPPDMIKVDTDGYDGRVLRGAKGLLVSERPSVLFEWHPKLCDRLGTDELEAFSVLFSAGYDRFLFFTKFGQFSHFGADNLEKLSQLCRESATLPDWHYDVVALHRESPVDDLSVADLRRWGSGGW